MARPTKDPSERKTAEVRIPVTDDQKKTIAEAAEADGADVATWARPLLLTFAQERLRKRSKRVK
jgi:uncharacterized protein (DUF1778 family)